MELIKKALKKVKHTGEGDDGWARKRALTALKYVKDENLKVLNAGCGYGHDSHEFKKAGHYVIGVDFNKDLVDFAVKNGFQDEGYVCDLNEKLPFSNEEFDVIFCSEVIEHLPIIDTFLEECNRILIGGGYY